MQDYQHAVASLFLALFANRIQKVGSDKSVSGTFRVRSQITNKLYEITVIRMSGREAEIELYTGGKQVKVKNYGSFSSEETKLQIDEQGKAKYSYIVFQRIYPIAEEVVGFYVDSDQRSSRYEFECILDKLPEVKTVYITDDQGSVSRKEMILYW